MGELYVKDAGVWSKVKQIHVKDAGAWKEAKEVYVRNGGTWVRAFAGGFEFTIVVASSAFNFNLGNQLIGLGWDGSSPVRGTVTINADTIVGSMSTSSYAFDMGRAFPDGSQIALVNNGKILGKGGAGGNGGTTTNWLDGSFATDATQAENGGAACRLMSQVTIVNNGMIGGGGGGGAGAPPGYLYDGNKFTHTYNGSGGGGGAGSAPGAGGMGMTLVGDSLTPTPLYSGSGTDAAGGNSVFLMVGGNTSGLKGGNGGGIGQPGGAATSVVGTTGLGGAFTFYRTPMSPGAAGAAVVGNQFAIWQTAGTRLGALTTA